MRTQTVYRKCKCTGKFFILRGLTVLHHKSCPVREIQEKYGLEVETYMFNIKDGGK